MTATRDTGKDCTRAWEAMPWVLQDNAPQDQRRWLAEHLAHCPACRDEFAQQQKLQRALAMPANVMLDPEAGLRRLMTRIDTEQAGEVMARARGGGWITRALVAVVLIQAMAIGMLGAGRWWPDATPAPYRTLGDPSQRMLPGAIRVVPDTSMDLADWNALLRSLHLDVVDGPNAVGAYTVVPADTSTSPEALRQLRATHGIRLAEPVNVPP
ncbi:anti-sigma factor family protein [Dyella telluris]|uniref:Zf-HC2 domain-containing protein n=1 Tax=Dyella telluris TaxID=2763498 RepID=A0A7G8PZZ9_9GAMM|nr:zf-HC2 domain-containing protein [Dyella telluris]QNK00107.1 zf-HC2 domain-containing protein [Dyella telluris]